MASIFKNFVKSYRQLILTYAFLIIDLTLHITPIVELVTVKVDRTLNSMIKDVPKTCLKLKQMEVVLPVKCHRRWQHKHQARPNRLHHQRNLVKCLLLTD